MSSLFFFPPKNVRSITQGKRCALTVIKKEAFIEMNLSAPSSLKRRLQIVTDCVCFGR